MKAALAVTTVLSVLAIGAIPALGLTPGTADEPAKPAKADTADMGRGPGDVPPGWAKHPGKIRGHGHGMAMRQWAHCVGDATRGLADGERLDREQACGGRPVPPGQLKKG
jgi:hypothetical protein